MNSGFKHIRNELRGRRSSRRAIRFLVVLITIAVFGDFIANEKPLVCSIEGKVMVPIVKAYGVELGLSGWPDGLGTGWHDKSYDWAVWPPVPYSPNTIDLANSNYKSPFASQEVSNIQFRHWLGTDQLGRDVLSGLIRGCRVSLLIGCLSMLIAALLGIPVGAAAGYFGDARLRRNALQIGIYVVFGLLVTFYLWQFATHIVAGGQAFNALIFLVIAFILGGLASILVNRSSGWFRTFVVPIDSLIMRSIEVVRSIPGFFLLFAILGVIENPSWLYVIMLIGVLRMPTITRYVRAEAYKLREQNFIDAARIIGLSDRQIIRRHIVPNALSPVIVTMAFGVGSAILLESGLSFLGIGMSLDQMSWGKLLSAARYNFAAWWLALFPGAMIFLTIAVFNILGDELTDILEVRSNRI